MKVILLHIILLLFTTTFSFGQNPLSRATKMNFTKEDARILNEENSIVFNGIYIDQIKVVIKKKVRVKILSDKGVSYYSKISIPETYDPLYFPHASPIRKIGWFYHEIKHKNFSCHIIRYKKDTIIPQKEVLVKNKRSADDNFYYKYESVKYKIPNIKPGDILEYNYEIEIPYSDNWFRFASFRIFFHGITTKENYSLKIRHHKKLEFSLIHLNNSTPDSTIEDKNSKYYYWNKQMISGCINEYGSKPYIDLPHIIFSIGLKSARSSGLFITTGSYIYINYLAGLRTNFHFDTHSKNRQSILITKFITETTNYLTNSSSLYKFKHIHNIINNDFIYKNDKEYFINKDVLDERIGSNMNRYVLREISRYNIYRYLMKKLNVTFRSSFLIDTRIGSISNYYFHPVYDNDYIFSLIGDNDIKYLYPKNSRYGLHLGEIPYYFEGTILKHFTNNTKDTSAKRLPLNTPTYQPSKNFRRTSVYANVFSEKDSIEFQAKTSLSGQFSTMTRRIYQDDYKDKTINPKYNMKLWEIGGKTKLHNSKIAKNSNEYPFRSDITAQYYNKKSIQNSNDTFSLDLTNWFNHISWDNIISTNRQLDYYTDFMGLDAYNYIITFDHNIELISPLEDISIKNNLGEFTFSIKQAQPNTVQISSNYVVSKPIVKKDDIRDVKNIFDTISNINNIKIQYKQL